MLAWLRRLFGGGSEPAPSAPPSRRRRRRPARPKLTKTRWRPPRWGSLRRGRPKTEFPRDRPYTFATTAWSPFSKLRYQDRSRDVAPDRLAELGLPDLRTPADLADFLDVGLGQLAWLTHRLEPKFRPPSAAEAHYVFQFVPKKSGDQRLIEAPKPLLKSVQRHVLSQILDKLPPHDAAHGFTAGRSILTNAEPHVGAAAVVSLDIENFYPSVRERRVNAIFRSMGYPGEVAIWLTRLTTSTLPRDLPLPPGRGAAYLRRYWNLGRHLPQGAPTSPALANLACYRLDVRLAGLTRAFGGIYTRYADDMTFSGPHAFQRSLKTFIPLAQELIRDEGFVVQAAKRRVRRAGSRLEVTGVVVNERLNVTRPDYDRLKAIVHNCVTRGPASQNREGVADFAAHLRGRIAHVARLNPAKGEKLLREFRKIDWGQ